MNGLAFNDGKKLRYWGVINLCDDRDGRVIDRFKECE